MRGKGVLLEVETVEEGFLLKRENAILKKWPRERRGIYSLERGGGVGGEGFMSRRRDRNEEFRDCWSA